MAILKKPIHSDPTLDAMNAAIEAAQHRETRRLYLGMSAIGDECSRKLWYSFRWVDRPTFSAHTLKLFEDGHRTEDLMAKRLRMVPGITLITHVPETGRQIGFSDFGGHFMGHIDGEIHGLLQAPKTPHVWEHKATDDKKKAELEKLSLSVGEKNALKQWDIVYYSQAVLYMGYGGYNRHYLTCSTPGGREETSVRTEADPKLFESLKAKAERIIFSDEPLPKVESFKCRWCDYKTICDGDKAPDRNCRTCLHSTPEREDGWICAKGRKGTCELHRYLPGLINGEVIDADPDGEWIEYKLENGTWRDEG